MRFSLGKLLYFIGFCAICFAVSQSEESGERVSLVTSLDFSPAGDQLLIAISRVLVVPGVCLGFLFQNKFLA